MRLLPANVRDAKEMARSLCDRLEYHELSSSPDGPLSLRQTQEAMARAMGYNGWHELTKLLSAPHEPVYADSRANDKLLLDFAGRLAKQLGFSYPHGVVLAAIQTAGTGYSPKLRRYFREAATPWGIAEFEEVVPGVLYAETGGRGGYLVRPERLVQMPPHLRLDGGWYEELGDVFLVTLAIPEFASALGALPCMALESLDLLAPTQERDEYARKSWAALERVFAGESDRAAGPLLDGDEPPPQRPASAMEEAAVNYLVACVLENRAPCMYPDGRAPDDILGLPPRLADWADMLSRLPMEGGTWPKLTSPWRNAWDGLSYGLAKEEANQAKHRELLESLTAKAAKRRRKAS